MSKPRRNTYLPARALALFGAMGTGLMFFSAACGGDETPVVPGGGTKKGGAGAAGATGAAASGGTAGGSAVNGGAAGSIPLGGNSGAGADAGAAGASANAGAAGASAGAAGNNGGGATAGSSGNGSGGTECSAVEPPTPTIVRHCRPPTDNECDGVQFDGVALHKPEGTSGNGFDDDCDGKVDEGCACEAGSSLGSTKDCYILPSSQTTGPNGTPPWGVVGTCATNSLGKLTCVKSGSGEFSKLTYGGGNCQGAQKGGEPEKEVCAAGDFNCDGVDLNAPGGCKCKGEPVVCPSTLFAKPFPDPNKVGQLSATQNGVQDIEGVDVKRWVNPVVADPNSVGNIRWTITGGPCDDILPHPTFAAFSTPTANWAASKLGVETEKLPLIPAEKQPSPTFPAGLKQGWVIQNNAPSLVYPAFSLSGDYYMTAKFQYKALGSDTAVDAECTQVVKVRAPGIRVELCWPEVGYSVTADGKVEQNTNDVDLHVARLQGNDIANGKHGWFVPTVGAQPLKYPQLDDCYWSPRAGCGNRINDGGNATGFQGSTPGWYPPNEEITDEPGGQGVCHGWGSRRAAGRACTSPRLDRDNIVCDPLIDDPNSPEKDPGQQGDVAQNFCGPENINIDGKVLKAGDRFAVGVQCYGCVSGKAPNRVVAHPRVNIYCDGELKKGIGYDPEIGNLSDQYPVLSSEGTKFAGSMWNVGIVEWTGDATNPCSIQTTAAGDKWNKDPWHEKSNGSEFQCVANGPLDSRGNIDDDLSFPNPNPPPQVEDWRFKPDGTYPADAKDLCPAD
jgi:hypothetical protein